MLNERSKRVLCAVVQSYIDNHTPVGSRAVTKKYPFNLSSATIRNIMADLEDMGFLVQPHTSAGRIPTDRGYRVFVDCIEPDESEDNESLCGVFNKRLSAKAGIDGILHEMIGTLAGISHYLVFASPVKSDTTTLNRIQLYMFKKRHIVAVVLTDEGVVMNKIIETDMGLTQKDLNRISDFLNSEFSGFSIDEIRTRIIKELERDKAIFDMIISKAIMICREALDLPQEELMMAGLSELVGLPDFTNKVNGIIKAIEDKHKIVTLLDEISDVMDVKVLIGSENPLEELRGLSIIVAPYKQGDIHLGNLGIIGPTRMDYSKTIRLVKAAAESLSEAIKQNGG